jgi:hypothetical protein
MTTSVACSDVVGHGSDLGRAAWCVLLEAAMEWIATAIEWPRKNKRTKAGVQK